MYSNLIISTACRSATSYVSRTGGCCQGGEYTGAGGLHPIIYGTMNEQGIATFFLFFAGFVASVIGILFSRPGMSWIVGAGEQARAEIGG